MTIFGFIERRYYCIEVLYFIDCTLGIQKIELYRGRGYNKNTKETEFVTCNSKLSTFVRIVTY